MKRLILGLGVLALGLVVLDPPVEPNAKRRRRRNEVEGPPGEETPVDTGTRFELAEDETLAEGVRRAAAAEAGAAAAALVSGGNDGSGEAVHEARKRIKRARALLRLARGHLPAELRRSENARLREAAQLLSAPRDRKVLARTSRRLVTEGVASSGFMQRVAGEMESRDEAAAGEPDDVVAAAHLLAETRGALTFTEAADDGFPGRGLRGSYGGGRKAMRTAREDGRAASFHEWRKRAKDLRHHLEFLSSIWPGVLPALEADLHRLTDHLGDANDLAVLARAVEAMPVSPDEEPVRGALLDRLAELRETRWKKAFGAGARLYAEKPDAFVALMKACWKTTR
jgi:CHAD domain-containing protein